MQTIKVKSALSTELLVEFDVIKTIEISDTIISGGEGGFGKVYKCYTVNNSVCSVDQLIKILTPNRDIHRKGYETIQKLQKKLKIKNQEVRQNGTDSIIKEYSALKAVPQFSFIGMLNGEEVYGYSANNLNSLGFISFSEALDKSIIQHVGFDIKIPMIYHLIKAFDFLSSIFYIHADLKEDALFLNISTKECVIIDFDSGAVADSSNDQPTTLGSFQDWLAPEIMGQFGKSIREQQEINVNLNSDRWSITVAIFYLICSSHPFFMLKDTGLDTIKNYFLKYRWPYIDPNEDYFNKDNESFYNQFVSWYKQNISVEIKKIFETTFNDGYSNPAMRSLYGSWKYALQKIQNPPQIGVFASDKKIRINSDPVKLHWIVKYEEELILQPGNINVTGMDSYNVSPVTDTFYSLIAKNYCGEHKKELEIRVSKQPPEIIVFKSDEPIRIGAVPINLSWNVDNCSELILNPGNINVDGKTSVEVEPMIDTTYTLIAKNYFGFECQKSLFISISDQPPIIKEFKSDNPIRLNSNPIKLQWQVESAHRLILNPENIDVTNKTNVEVKPLGVTTYTLLAESFFGIKTEKSITINVSKDPPIIEKFEYEAIDLLDNIFKLSWEVIDAEHICILPFLGDISNKTEAEICLTDQNVFTLTAKTLFGVTASKTISLSMLFNITPSDSFFNKEPDDSILNLEINPEIFNQFKTQYHGSTKN
ncbi:MAG: serine/threonine protein kinase [Bacteroidales bacterium]|nr:serine/threonine protein kinase [Bacteroidales bacterium]